MSEGKDESREGRVWHPIEDIRSLAESMCRAFDAAPGRASGRKAPSRYPEQKLELVENAHEFLIKVELPDVQKKDLHVNVAENSVTIFARWTKQAKPKGKDGGQRVESAEQLYSRSIQLPAAVKADQARASFRDRVLKIFLPRAKPSQVRRIDVK